MALRSILVWAIFVFASTLATAQEAGYTQFYLNLPAVNPGFTGIENYTDVKLMVRQGWNNFGVKNSNFYGSAYGVLNSGYRSALKNNSLRISDPGAFDEMLSNRDSRKTLRRKHGVGGMLSGRDLGPFKSTTISMNYAYHLPLSTKLNFAMGTTIRYNNSRTDFTGYTVRDELNDLFYQQLVRSGQGKNNAIINDFGLAMYSDKGVLGLSSAGLIASVLGSDSEIDLETAQNLSLHGGYNFSIGPRTEMSSAAMISYSELYDLNWQASVRVRYRGVVYMGVAYQDQIKISGVFGIGQDGRYNINYSYDYYTSAASSFRISVHEVVLGFSLFNKYLLPTKMW